MTDNVTQLPDLRVVLDLDALERPSDDVKPPFVVRVGGKDITFADPNEIEWSVLAGIEATADIISVALNKDDRQHFRSTPMKTWKFNALLEAYYQHYDLEDKIREAKRRQALSGI